MSEEKVKTIKKEVLKEEQKYNLYQLLDILFSPITSGMKETAERKAIPFEDLKLILNTVWTNIMSKNEWEEMISELEKLEGENNLAKHLKEHENRRENKTDLKGAS